MKKILIALILLFSMILNLSGCYQRKPSDQELDEAIDNGYIKTRVWDTYNSGVVCGLSEEGKMQEIVYVPDRINYWFGEYLVIQISPELYGSTLDFESEKLKRIYFPWSVGYSSVTEDELEMRLGSVEYVFSTSTLALVTNRKINDECKNVVPLTVYKKIMHDELIGNMCIVSEENKKYFVPANIMYSFNFDMSENEGYFFIDLLEESGKITKPPYDPKREGYTFDGWYKEPECVNKWDFDTDTVTITFDDEGNRIYEEIKLYAKWKEG